MHSGINDQHAVVAFRGPEHDPRFCDLADQVQSADATGTGCDKQRATRKLTRGLAKACNEERSKTPLLRVETSHWSESPSEWCDAKILSEILISWESMMPQAGTLLLYDMHSEA